MLGLGSRSPLSLRLGRRTPQPQSLGSKLPNSASSRVWVRGFLSLRVSVTKLDRFFFPRLLSIPNEASSRDGYRLLSSFGEEQPFHPCSHHPSEEPASCGIRQETGRDNLLYLVHTIPCAHNFLLVGKYSSSVHCHINSLWCHSSSIICCMRAYCIEISNFYACEFSSSHTNS